MPEQDVEPPESIDYGNLDQYSEAEIEAYNERREQELVDEINQLEEDKQDAVATLRKDAQESIETETVPVGEETLEVRTRIPPEVEPKIEAMRDAEHDGDIDVARRLNCECAAAMVETPGFDDAEVWEIAAEAEGMHWLGEVTDKILAPANENLESLQGNRDSRPDSENSPAQTVGKRSGWDRRR